MKRIFRKSPETIVSQWAATNRVKLNTTADAYRLMATKKDGNIYYISLDGNNVAQVTISNRRVLPTSLIIL